MPTYAEMLKYVRDARAGFEQEVSKLYVHGIPKYDEATMREILATLRSQRNEALRNIEADTRAERERLIESVQLSGEFASDEILTTSEQADAQRRAPNIEREIAGMDSQQLAARLEGIQRHGSKVDKYLYASLATRRNREDKRRNAPPRGTSRGASASLSPLDMPLAELDRDLYGEERERRANSISGDLEKIDEILTESYLARNEARDVLGAYAKRNYHKLPRSSGPLGTVPGTLGRRVNEIANDRRAG